MNTLVKITLPLLFLVTSGCVHHTRHYSDGYRDGDGYGYGYGYIGGYNSYYPYPVYYGQDIYVQPPSHEHRYDSYQGQYAYPNKHAKPNNRYNNYQKPNKHRKTDLSNQYRNKRHHKTEKFIPKNSANHRQYNSSNKQNNRHLKPSANKNKGYSPSFKKREKPENMNYPINNQPASSFGSKHRKSNNSFSAQGRQYSGKRTKR